MIAKGTKHAAATTTKAQTWMRALRRPLRRQRWTTPIGTSAAGQSFAAKPSPSSAPLRTGRSRIDGDEPADREQGRPEVEARVEERAEDERRDADREQRHPRALRAGIDRTEGQGCNCDAGGADHAHQHRERGRVAPAHVGRQEHRRQGGRWILEGEVAIRHAPVRARAPHSARTAATSESWPCSSQVMSA